MAIKTRRTNSKKSKLEAAFELYLVYAYEAGSIPEYVSEYRFHPERKWRFDFAFPEKKLAIEIEGGVWSRGRHTRGSGFVADCEKYNEAALLGWTVLRFTGEHIKSGEALSKTIEVLEANVSTE
jgi:very-short-patch-repair endonuclease